MKDLCKNIDFKKLDFVLLNGDMSNRLRSQQHMMEAYLDTCVSMFATHTPLFFNRGIMNFVVSLPIISIVISRLIQVNTIVCNM